MTVFTIGYEGLGMEKFISLLVQNHIETVVDIREVPISRKAGFSKKALSNALFLAGFEYKHIAKLGCPKIVRYSYRCDGNWKRYTKDFLAHLELQNESIGELSGLVATSNCVLLCYEADFNFCHRTMVANAVHKKCGADVKHIVNSDTKTASLDLRSLQSAYV